MAFESLTERLSAAFKRLRGKGRLSEQDIKDAMREVRIALLEADVNYKVAKDFIKDVTERSLGADVMESLTPAQQVIKIVNEELIKLMGGDEPARIHIKSKPPTVIMMCGLQGAGKTTHCAKLAKRFKKEGHRPLLVACDIYRPAAVDQLCIVGEAAGVGVFKMDGAKPEEIAAAAVRHAKDHGDDIVIIDTAGRLHVDDALMQELTRIKQAVEVDETLLVIDAMAGQDAVNVARSFGEQTGLDGVILTKLDGDTRGGAALSIRAVTGKPIKFCGTGEKLSDIEVFHPERMASRILGMGDVLTLIEKAQSAYTEEEAREMQRKMKEKAFTLEDYLVQIDKMKNMGDMSQMLGMIPGLAGKLKGQDLSVDENNMKKVKAMIQSMTPAERQNPDIIKGSHKKRIAAGSGTTIQDINSLLKQFAQVREMMSRMSNMGKRGFRMPF